MPIIIEPPPGIVNDFLVEIQQEIIIQETTSYVSDFILVIETKLEYKFVKINSLLKAWKYKELAKIDLETLAQAEKFLADYHVIRHLAETSNTDKVTVCKVLLNFSNLLRLMSAWEVDQAFFLTFRISRVYIKSLRKDVFVITDY